MKIKDSRSNDPSPISEVDRHVGACKHYAEDETAVMGLSKYESDVFEQLQNSWALIRSRRLLDFDGDDDTTPRYAGLRHRPYRTDVGFDSRNVSITSSWRGEAKDMPTKVVYVDFVLQRRRQCVITSTSWTNGSYNDASLLGRVG